jgi:hypothetical protein
LILIQNKHKPIPEKKILPLNHYTPLLMELRNQIITIKELNNQKNENNKETLNLFNRKTRVYFIS